MTNADTAALANVDLDMLAYDFADTLDRGEHGLGDITQDEIRAELPAFLAACLARAAERDRNAAPNEINPATGLPRRFDAAPRAKSHGGVVHVDADGYPILGGVPFGHAKQVGPERCARCWERANGAPAREDATGGRGYRPV